MLKFLLISIFTTIIYANSPNVALYLKSDKVKNSFFIGSGSIISEDGYILTTYHNLIFNSVKNTDYIVKIDMEYKSRLVAYDRELDLAIIKIEEENLNYFNISKNFKLGERVFALGFFEDNDCHNEGVILEFEKLNRKLKIIKSNIEAKKGQSGGALINENSDLIGIIFMKESNSSIVYAISAFSIISFLDKNINLNKKNYTLYYLSIIVVVIFVIILKLKFKNLLLYSEELQSLYKLNSNMRVGRDILNEIYLQNKKISKEHAIIKKIDGKFYIKDLNSINGTFLNSNRIPPFKNFHIKKGDKINFGLVVLFEIK